MRHISENAFRHNSIVPNSNTIRLGENLYYLEYYAFSDSFNSSSSVTIMIPSNVIVLDYRSFTFQNNLSKSGNTIEIGTSEIQSKLDLYYFPTGRENEFARIDTNYSEQYGTINFYTNKYSADSRITDEKGNSITLLDAFKGVVINVINNGG